MEALRHNNYSDWFLKQTINRMNISKTKSRVTSNRQEKKSTVILPYVSGLSQKITRILKSFDVQVCTKPLKTIKTSYLQLKTELNLLDDKELFIKFLAKIDLHCI